MRKESGKVLNKGKLITLHLLPGILMVVCQLLLINFKLIEKMPNVFLLAAAGSIGIIGWELGCLFYWGRKECGSWNFLPLLGFKSKLSAGRLAVYSGGLFLFLGICFSVFKPVSDFLMNTAFSFMPKQFHLGESLESYSQEVIIWTLLVYVFLFAVIYPIIEELYFRGFLLARMKAMGQTGIFLNTALFACYHLWSPWLIPVRIFAMLPLYYVVAKKDSLKLAIVVHCLANMTDILPIIGLLL